MFLKRSSPFLHVAFLFSFHTRPCHMQNMDQDNAVGTATKGRRVRVSNPVGDDIFRTRLVRPWRPPTHPPVQLLLGLFPRSNRGVALTAHYLAREHPHAPCCKKCVLFPKKYSVLGNFVFLVNTFCLKCALKLNVNHPRLHTMLRFKCPPRPLNIKALKRTTPLLPLWDFMACFIENSAFTFTFFDTPRIADYWLF